MAKKIINSGLDLMIYSFDGGSKKSYEKMRPGRFKKNNFNVFVIPDFEDVLSDNHLRGGNRSADGKGNDRRKDPSGHCC